MHIFVHMHLFVCMGVFKNVWTLCEWDHLHKCVCVCVCMRFLYTRRNAKDDSCLSAVCHDTPPPVSAGSDPKLLHYQASFTTLSRAGLISFTRIQALWFHALWSLLSPQGQTHSTRNIKCLATRWPKPSAHHAHHTHTPDDHQKSSALYTNASPR